MKKKNPTIGDGLEVDVQVLIESRLLVQANSGGGKSWALRRLLEQTAPFVQHFVIDPEGEFPSLRERFDYVICAPHEADAVATPKTASLLARRLLEAGVSAILNIFDLKAHERQTFVRLFLEALINAPRSLWKPVLVVLDEAHVFCPQSGSAEAAQAVIDLATRGRKRGLGACLATQRLAKLHKDAAAEMRNKMIGQTGLDVDVKRAAEELGISPREALENLRQLPAGDFFVFGPALSPVVKRIHVGDVATTHPRPGARLMQAPPAPSKAILARLAKLADLQREADLEAKTVEELKAENGKLRREVAAAERKAAGAGVPEAEVRSRIAAAVAAAKPSPQALGDAAAKAVRSIAKLASDALAAAEAAGAAESFNPEKVSQIMPLTGELLRRPEAVRPKPATVSRDAGLSGPEQRILDSLAWLESIGVDSPETVAVAFLAGYTASGGAFNNPRSSLKSKGLIEYLGNGMLRLTGAGRELANAPATALTPEDLHVRIRDRLPGPERKLFDVIIGSWPQSISNDELAAATSYSANGGAFNNPKSRLKTLGLIEYPARGSVRARDILFPSRR